jgi:hypothetical protein
VDRRGAFICARDREKVKRKKGSLPLLSHPAAHPHENKIKKEADRPPSSHFAHTPHKPCAEEAQQEAQQQDTSEGLLNGTSSSHPLSSTNLHQQLLSLSLFPLLFFPSSSSFLVIPRGQSSENHNAIFTHHLAIVLILILSPFFEPSPRFFFFTLLSISHATITTIRISLPRRHG